MVTFVTSCDLIGMFLYKRRARGTAYPTIEPGRPDQVLLM